MDDNNLTLKNNLLTLVLMVAVLGSCVTCKAIDNAPGIIRTWQGRDATTGCPETSGGEQRVSP